MTKHHDAERTLATHWQGLSKHRPLSLFPKKKIEAGAEVEIEHVGYRPLARRIAADHLTEDPNYYEKIKRLGLAKPQKTNTKAESRFPMGSVIALIAGLGLLYFATRGPKQGKGIAVPPTVQLYYVVREGDMGPRSVAQRIVGDENRYLELIDANPSAPTVGERMNPNSTGFNFARFVVGDKLLLPKAWNAFIDGEGNFAGSTTPFPAG